jgi:hypothetical protein
MLTLKTSDWALTSPEKRRERITRDFFIARFREWFRHRIKELNNEKNPGSPQQAAALGMNCEFHWHVVTLNDLVIIFLQL